MVCIEVCFNCAIDVFENTPTMHATVGSIHHCCSKRHDCTPHGVQLRLCTTCELRLFYPAAQAGDYLIRYGDEMCVCTTADLTVDVVAMRLGYKDDDVVRMIHNKQPFTRNNVVVDII